MAAAAAENSKWETTADGRKVRKAEHRPDASDMDLDDERLDMDEDDDDDEERGPEGTEGAEGVEDVKVSASADKDEV